MDRRARLRARQQHRRTPHCRCGPPRRVTGSPRAAPLRCARAPRRRPDGRRCR
jgi:hypothetical protein